VSRIDITTEGSRNIGATNVAREVGILWGIVTLLLDAGKGFLPVVLSGLLFECAGFWPFSVGICALLGHQFSIFRRLRGGKGVATALGIYLALSPMSRIACAISLVLFVAVVFRWKYVSLGSMASSLFMPLLLALFGEPLAVVGGSAVVSALIIMKHADNIRRLREGQENPWKRGKNHHERASRSLSSSSSE
jgi:glycerol-3-phosphate acyltransferase PlsY